MKTLGITLATVGAILTAPIALLGIGAVVAHEDRCSPEGTTAQILATIRTVESGGRYDEHARIGQPGTGSPSGAYQFLRSTWAGEGGYTDAWEAPAPVQDTRAERDVTAILTANHDDVGTIPVVWYLGHVPAVDSPEWDQVPNLGANTITPRAYQERWMTVLAEQGGAGCGTLDPNATRLPVDRSVLARWMLTKPHHDYPAADLPIPAGTRVYAMIAGTARIVDDNLCGWGVVVDTGPTGEWTYCHLSAQSIHAGATVGAGEQIGLSGGVPDAPGAGHSSGQHLHVGVRIAGESRCPQPFLLALWDGQPPPHPTALPVDGCVYNGLGVPN